MFKKSHFFSTSFICGDVNPAHFLDRLHWGQKKQNHLHTAAELPQQIPRAYDIRGHMSYKSNPRLEEMSVHVIGRLNQQPTILVTLSSLWPNTSKASAKGFVSAHGFRAFHWPHVPADHPSHESMWYMNFTALWTGSEQGQDTQEDRPLVTLFFF